MQRPDEGLPRLITAQVTRTMFRGTPQYESCWGKYKLVVGSQSLPPKDGEIWLLAPIKLVGTILFCSAYQCMRTADGQHPVVVLANERYIGGEVTVLYHGHHDFWTQSPLVSATTTDAGMHLSFADGKTLNVPDENHFHWKYGNYGRYIGEGWLDRRRAQIVFYPPSENAVQEYDEEDEDEQFDD